MIKDKIKEQFGEEFDVNFNGRTLTTEVTLRLGAGVHISGELLRNGRLPDELVVLERDRLLIGVKRKVTDLLWKYLGRIEEV